MSTSVPTVQPTRQQSRAASRRHSKSSGHRLAGYLTATAGCCGLATTADAAVIAIDIADVGVANAGLATGESKTLFAVGGISFGAQNRRSQPGDIYRGVFTGFYSSSDRGQLVAYYGADRYPIDRFATSDSIGATLPTEGSPFWGNASLGSEYGQFRYRYYNPGTQQYVTVQATSWGSGSYAGFRFGDNTNGWNYGYIEATWNTTTQTFVILSAAYETEVNTPILAGAQPVPEPGTAAMAFGAVASLCLGGQAFKRWKKQRRREQPQEQSAPAA
jgi:hypothetical protein